MAFFFGDGFDLYAATSDPYQGGSYWDSGTGGSFVLQPGRFAGSRAIQNAGISTWLTKSSGVNDSVHHFVVAIEQTAAISGSTLGFYIQLLDGTTNQCAVVFRSDGAILLTSGGPTGTVLATYTGALTVPSTWYAFEIEVVINNTTGSISVRKNGNTSNDFTLGSLNTRGGTANNYANKITLGQQAGINNQLVDDFLWRSDASSVPWVGDIRCYTRRPDADASVQWTRPGTFQMQPFTGTSAGVSSSSNGVRYAQFVSQGGTIGSVNLTINATGTFNLKCALYRADGTGGNPGTVIQSATAAIANPAIGTAAFTFSPAVSIPKGTTFYVAIAADAAITSAFLAGNSTPYNTMGFSGTTTYASFPVANPASLSAAGQLSVFPVVTPTANADAVADLYFDAAASYLTDSNVNDSDLYTIQAIGGTPSTIIGLTTRGLFEKSDAGTRNVAVQLKSGATTVQSASTPLNTTWSWISRTDLVDPATGAAWTPTAVNNLQIGAQVKA